MKKNRNSRCSTLTWTPYFREMVPSFLVQVTYLLPSTYQYVSKHNGHQSTFLNSLRFHFNLWGLYLVKNSKFLKQMLVYYTIFFHFSILCHLYFHPQCTRKKKYVFCNYQLLKYNICKYLCIKNTIFLKIDRNKIQKLFWSILQSISFSGCYRLLCTKKSFNMSLRNLYSKIIYH